MVKLNRRLKILIIGVAFAAIGWLCQQSLIKFGKNKIYMESQVLSHKLTPKELYDFLVVWDKMQKRGIKKYLNQVSLQNENIYPWQIVKWLELNNWSAERFFYDEQRLQDILNCVDLKISLEANTVVNKKTNADLKDVISKQEQGLKTCQFDEEEMNLIENNREQIKAFFVKIK